jgi:hypothetical protein
MAGYGSAHLDEIDELADGRLSLTGPIPGTTIGHTSFGATVWTGA